jgi:hypothetical protein
MILRRRALCALTALAAAAVGAATAAAQDVNGAPTGDYDHYVGSCIVFKGTRMRCTLLLSKR